VFATEVFIEFIERIEAFSENHLEIREDITGEIERIMFGIIFPSGLQDSEIFEILEFTTDSIDLFIYITTELSDKKVFFRVESMLQEEFFEEFFSTI
jgi:hypothetical protein